MFDRAFQKRIGYDFPLCFPHEVLMSLKNIDINHSHHTIPYTVYTYNIHTRNIRYEEEEM